MDESSPVYENFMNKMSAMGSGRPKINRTTFNIGANVLERRVANNSRKITIIKSILKNQKIDIGEKLTTPEPDKTSEVSKELASVNATLLSIGNILSTDFANRIAIEKGQSQLLKAEKQRRRRSLAESGIESVKKIGKGLGKITSPIREGGSNILKALSLLGLGVAGNLAFDFLKSDFGQEKIGEFFTFLKDNWKWMLGTIIGVGGALALGSIISGIAGIGLALKGLVFLKPLLILGGLFAAGYVIPKMFNMGLDKVIDYFEDDPTGKKNFVGNPIPGAPTDAKPGDYFKDSKGQIWVKQDFNSSNGGWSKTSKIPNAKLQQFAVDAGLLERKGKDLTLDKSNKPKITEITLPIEELTGRSKIVNPDLPTTTDVPYATSINLENEYMKKTPKIHGIKL